MSETEKEVTNKEKDEIKEEQVLDVLDHWNITHKHLNYAANNDPTDIPYLVIDH